MNNTRHTEHTRRFFDTAAAGWATRYAKDATIAARKSRFLDCVNANLKPPADILDFGCGSGDISLHLADAGFRLTGFDSSPAMIEQARLADSANRIQWISRETADATLPFGDATFDAIIASSSLEYVPTLETTLNEFARLLRIDGWLFATVPDMRDPRRRHERWLRFALALPGVSRLLSRTRWREGAVYLQISSNRISPAAWRTLLTASGLACEQLPDPTGPLLMLTARKLNRR